MEIVMKKIPILVLAAFLAFLKRYVRQRDMVFAPGDPLYPNLIRE